MFVWLCIHVWNYLFRIMYVSICLFSRFFCLFILVVGWVVCVCAVCVMLCSVVVLVVVVIVVVSLWCMCVWVSVCKRVGAMYKLLFRVCRCACVMCLIYSFMLHVCRISFFKYDHMSCAASIWICSSDVIWLCASCACVCVCVFVC